MECLRLDKESFQSILSSRKELAEAISSILAERLAERTRKLPQDWQEGHGAPQRAELVDKIRRFGLVKH